MMTRSLSTLSDCERSRDSRTLQQAFSDPHYISYCLLSSPISNGKKWAEARRSLFPYATSADCRNRYNRIIRRLSAGQQTLIEMIALESAGKRRDSAASVSSPSLLATEASCNASEIFHSARLDPEIQPHFNSSTMALASSSGSTTPNSQVTSVEDRHAFSASFFQNFPPGRGMTSQNGDLSPFNMLDCSGATEQLTRQPSEKQSKHDDRSMCQMNTRNLDLASPRSPPVVSEWPQSTFQPQHVQAHALLDGLIEFLPVEISSGDFLPIHH